MAVIGLLLVLSAAVIAVDGIVTNTGASHAVGRSVDVLGYHLHGSTGKLLLVGVVVGAAGMLGLNVLLAGLGRGFRRRVSRRQERGMERRQTKGVIGERDRLAEQLDREHTARLRAEEEGTPAVRLDDGTSGEVAEPSGTLRRHRI